MDDTTMPVSKMVLDPKSGGPVPVSVLEMRAQKAALRADPNHAARLQAFGEALLGKEGWADLVKAVAKGTYRPRRRQPGHYRKTRTAKDKL